jgi:hypothetical protein
MTMNTLAPHADADFARQMAHDVEIRLQTLHSALEDKLKEMSM